MHAMWLMIAVLCTLALAYRFYSKFIAAKILALDDSRLTPAHRLSDGHNYHPTNKWVLFGHHFAAISGAGPLIGPVLAAQFGYLPGLLWILIGVVLGGAVQDFIILTLSTRRDGQSLAHIAHREIGPVAGTAATIGILFVLVVALAGLGKVVTKALGGERVEFPSSLVDGKQYEHGTRFVSPVIEIPAVHYAPLPTAPPVRPGRGPRTPAAPSTATAASTTGRTLGVLIPFDRYDNRFVYNIPVHTTIIYPNGSQTVVTKPFKLDAGAVDPNVVISPDNGTGSEMGRELEVQPGMRAFREIKGSSWGTFTIFLTIPIAILVGWYMFKFRQGKIIEASVLGGLMVLGAVYLGQFVQTQPGEETALSSLLGSYFNLTGRQVGIAMAVYGFLASILPVWLLLTPRDYLSSFLKIGTVALLVMGVIFANPPLHAPALNHLFLSGGPTVKGSIFPFVFITIMCGAISGFHSLVASGTTPKMLNKESDARAIGYGAMLIEGLVGIVALIAAASLPNLNYYQMNTGWSDLPKYQQDIAQLAEQYDHRDPQQPQRPLGEWEKLTGETLTGRTGGAVTLAVGMAGIFDQAAANLLGRTSSGVKFLEGLIPFWYHFAIMFEALFILTTIDAGTRVGRFLLQEVFGRVKPAWGRTHWWPGAIAATTLLVLAWWYFLDSNSIDAIWPMFGIANQLLAVMALAIGTVALVRAGKGRYAWVTLLPMAFVTATTMTAAVILVGRHAHTLGDSAAQLGARVNAWASIGLIVGIVICTLVILVGAFRRIVQKEMVSANGQTPGA